MKLFSILTLLLFSISGFSQELSEHNEMQEPDFHKMKERLNLSDQQVEDIKKLFQDLKSQAKEIKENSGITEEERKAKLKETRDANEARLKEVLSEDQYENFKKLREERMEQRKKRRSQRNPAPK